MSRDQKAVALKVIDASDLIKAKFPKNPPQLSAAQLEQIQRVLDAYFINLDVDRQLEELDGRSIVGRTRDGRAVHDDSKRVSQETIMKLKKNRIVLKEEKLIIRLDFEKMLAADALRPTSDNPDEAAYLLKVKGALATQGLWLNIFRNSSQMGRTQYTAANDHRGWFVVLYYGGDKRHEITTDNGRLTRQDLLKVPLFKIGYYDAVHNGPALRLLKTTVNSVNSKIRVMLALHHDYSNKSLRGKILDWALREGVGGSLGMSVELPNEKIWNETAQLVTRASSLINDGKLNEANKLLTLAAFQAEWGANALAGYIQFVNAVKPGVSAAYQVLSFAEWLGSIAEKLLLLRALAGGLYRLLTRSSLPALEEGASTVAKRQLPSATPRQLPAGQPTPPPEPAKIHHGLPVENTNLRYVEDVYNTTIAQPKNGTLVSVPKINRLSAAEQARLDDFHSAFVEWLTANPNASLAEKLERLERANRGIWGDWFPTR